jgi:hypothetical protein
MFMKALESDNDAEGARRVLHGSAKSLVALGDLHRSAARPRKESHTFSAALG